MMLYLVGVLGNEDLSACALARITWWKGTEVSGSCGYGQLSPLNLPVGMMNGASYENIFDHFNKCGVCCEMAGLSANIKFLATDLFPATEVGTSDGGMVHFDLSEDAFSM